jgi:hypothetical protein
MNAPISQTPSMHVRVALAGEEGMQMPTNSGTLGGCFLRCMITCTVYALLYHSGSVKNTMTTKAGLFL